MTTRDTPFAPGTPCWVDLLTGNIDQAKTFYGSLLGWTFGEGSAEFGGYLMAFSDGSPVAGMMPNDPSMNSPDVWSTYLATADIEATTAAASAAGATVLAPVMAVADVGSMAMLSDPAGAVFGLWQAGTHTGFGRYNEPGSVTWDQVISKSFPVTVSFYEQVFGWGIDKMSDADGMRYYLGQVDGQTVAGIMDGSSLPAEVPSHWSVYFSVADADESVAKLVELGGTVVRPAEDSPFGRMADVQDPFGTPFSIHSDKLLNPPAAE